MGIYGNQGFLKIWEFFFFFEKVKIWDLICKNVIQGDSTINKSIISGRRTRAFNFKLTFETLALRLSLGRIEKKKNSCLAFFLGLMYYS